MVLVRALSIFIFLFLFNSKLVAEEVKYVDIQSIHPAQLRYSSKNVEKHVKRSIAQGWAFRKKDSFNWNYAFNDGTSIMASKSALPVVRSSFGFVLLDGHHAILTSLVLGATHVPIKEFADLSFLTEEEFWFEAERYGWAYLYDLNRRKHFPPKNFNRLKDDSNRYFATISARKYPENGSIENSVGLEYPLWIKIGKDIPFIELMVSDALRDAGFVYEYDSNYEQFLYLVEKARPILLKANIPGLRVIPKRTHYTNLKLNKV